jgi:CSLREA domain-containing protein
MRAIRAVLIVSILPLSSGNLQADTFQVTKTVDTDDGTCDADCSLREAMGAANASPGADDGH